MLEKLNIDVADCSHLEQFDSLIWLSILYTDRHRSTVVWDWYPFTHFKRCLNKCHQVLKKQARAITDSPMSQDEINKRYCCVCKRVFLHNCFIARGDNTRPSKVNFLALKFAFLTEIWKIARETQITAQCGPRTKIVVRSCLRAYVVFLQCKGLVTLDILTHNI